mgnify:CR=1 FL=1
MIILFFYKNKIKYGIIVKINKKLQNIIKHQVN